MAITIRNKETEALIRTIGRRTGEGPSAVIRRLAEKEALQQPASVTEEEIARRLTFMKDLRRRYPPPQRTISWSDVEEEMDSIFGDGFD
jgi:hypothetical protein